MDEISLNIAALHCRPPLSGGENARLKKTPCRKFSASPEKEMWRVRQKKRRSVKYLGAQEQADRRSRIAGKARQNGTFAGDVIPVSGAWYW
jgi:hypothetical protein